MYSLSCGRSRCPTSFWTYPLQISLQFNKLMGFHQVKVTRKIYIYIITTVGAHFVWTILLTNFRPLSHHPAVPDRRKPHRNPANDGGAVFASTKFHSESVLMRAFSAEKKDLCLFQVFLLLSTMVNHHHLNFHHLGNMFLNFCPTGPPNKQI